VGKLHTPHSGAIHFSKSSSGAITAPPFFSLLSRLPIYPARQMGKSRIGSAISMGDGSQVRMAQALFSGLKLLFRRELLVT